MKLKIHLLTEAFIFAILYLILGFKASFIITLFHFIPAVDFIMFKFNLFAKLHRKLFHNIFVMIIASLPVFYFTGFTVGSLSILNFILHLIMDLDMGGVMLFFPFSKFKLKLK